MAKYKIQLHPESAPLTVSSREDVEKIFGKRPWSSRSEEIMNIQSAEGDSVKSTSEQDVPLIENKEL